MHRTVTSALRYILLPGLLLGILTGLVVGLLDGGAFTAWAMFLGALGGVSSGAGGIAVGALVMFLLRNANAQARRLGTAVGVGLGAGGTFLLLAMQLHVVEPWHTVGAVVVLTVAGLWAYAKYSTPAAVVSLPG